MMFVLEVLQERCEREGLQNGISQAVGCYEASAEYVDRIDDDFEDRSIVAALMNIAVIVWNWWRKFCCRRR